MKNRYRTTQDAHQVIKEGRIQEALRAPKGEASELFLTVLAIELRQLTKQVEDQIQAFGPQCNGCGSVRPVWCCMECGDRRCATCMGPEMEPPCSHS